MPERDLRLSVLLPARGVKLLGSRFGHQMLGRAPFVESGARSRVPVSRVPPAAVGAFVLHTARLGEVPDIGGV
jgi:hypothetical protein